MTTTNATFTDPILEAYECELIQFGARALLDGDRYNIACCWDRADSRRVQIIASRDDDLIPQGYFHVSDFVAEHEAEDEFGPWSKADAELAIRRYFEHTAR